MRECQKHGVTRFTPGGRCAQCSIDSVDAARKRKKRLLVEALGGECILCGYKKCHRALQFHHVDPATKSFSLSDKARSYSLERLLEEAKKCVLLCGNCHMEVEEGITSLVR